MARNISQVVSQGILRRIHVLIFLFSFAIAVPAYIESSFLEGVVGRERVGLLFTISYLLGIAGMLILPFFVHRFGKRNCFTVVTLMVAASALLLALPIPWYLAVGSFAVFTTTLWLVTLGFDLAMEQHTSNRKTGSLRGWYLTMMNLGWVLSPIVMGVIGDGYGVEKVFGASFFLLIPVVFFFPTIWKSTDDRAIHDHGKLWKGIAKIIAHDSLWRIIVIAFILQFFYSWMVIYLPLHLSQTIGFSWSTIGIIFSVMLLPFILFAYPAGRIADRWLGEKELLTAGLGIMAFSSIAINWIPGAEIGWWMAILFATRVGASIVESMRDSYFYKHVDSDDVVVIDIFHIIWLLAYVVGPLFATLCLRFVSYAELFPILGVVIIVLAVPSLWGLRDTK